MNSRMPQSGEGYLVRSRPRSKTSGWASTRPASRTAAMSWRGATPLRTSDFVNQRAWVLARHRGTALVERGFKQLDSFTDRIKDRMLAPKRCGHKGLIKEEVLLAFRSHFNQCSDGKTPPEKF
jgi:hypothetical protein